MLERLFEKLTSLFVLIFPLVNNLLLLDHDLVGSLLFGSVLLLGLQELVLQLGDFYVAVIVKFVHAVVVDHF